MLNEKIKLLIQLQELDGRLDGLSQSRARLSPQREGLRAEVKALQTRFDDTKKALTQAQVTKKSLELDIEAKDQVVRKSTGELNSVKSNDAYKALLTQMEEAKKAKAALEDQVLEVMESMDALLRESKENDKHFQQDKAAIEAKIAGVDQEEKRLDAEIEARKKERDAFAEGLPSAVREQYNGIRRGRSGVRVVVPIKGTICGGCKMSLPPRVLNDVMKKGDVVTCETCSSILFVPEAPAENASEAPAQQPAV